MHSLMNLSKDVVCSLTTSAVERAHVIQHCYVENRRRNFMLKAGDRLRFGTFHHDPNADYPTLYLKKTNYPEFTAFTTTNIAVSLSEFIALQACLKSSLLFPETHLESEISLVNYLKFAEEFDLFKRVEEARRFVL